MIAAARRWTEHLSNPPQLWVIDGQMLTGVPSSTYDLVYCTISFQHIASYEIRMSLLREFHRVLKPGGRMALQLAYTTDPRKSWLEHAAWRESRNDAVTSNAAHDVRLDATGLLDMQEDVENLGFEWVGHNVEEPPHSYPGTQWLFVHAKRREDD